MLMKYLRLARTLIRGCWTVLVQFPDLTQTQKLEAFQLWAQLVLSDLNIKVECQPIADKVAAPSRPMLLVANHISWLDILVIQACVPCVFVAKWEVRQWPVVGFLAERCGVIFVDRNSKSAARDMVEQVTTRLDQGHWVAGFPEGTSSIGERVGPFHANLFQAAITAKVPVKPVVLRYRQTGTGRRSSAVAFIDDMSFAQSLHQVMRQGGLQAALQPCPIIDSLGYNRRYLAKVSQDVIARQLETLRLMSQ
jgi:1-acyl-sn-glycerol-3-phosphate acyltransferase